MNLRLPEHMSARDYQALIDTVMGAPEESILDPYARTHGLTLEQRHQWWRLVQAGHDVNVALMVVREML